VVFSSGFFGFFAHAGFLAALRELDINPVGYSGSSSGAILAAMAASGMTEAYINQLKIVRMKGIQVIEVKTAAPSTGPNRLDRGLSAYESAKASTLKTLS
jgi:predicted acylesterase/phospholipase RssA